MIGHISIFIITLISTGAGCYVGLLAVDKRNKRMNTPPEGTETPSEGRNRQQATSLSEAENSSLTEQNDAVNEDCSAHDTRHTETETKDGEQKDCSDTANPSSVISAPPKRIRIFPFHLLRKRNDENLESQNNNRPSPLDRVDTSNSYTDTCCMFDNEDSEAHIRRSVRKQDSRYRTKLNNIRKE